MTDQLRVAYLVSQYPALSHTFIEREVQGLRAQGVEVHTFSINACPPEQLKTKGMQEDAKTTTVIKSAPKTSIAAAHARLLHGHPQAWARLMRLAAVTGEASPRSRIWQLFYAGEAVVLYDEMRRRGLRHVHAHFANVSADVARLVVALGREIDGVDGGWAWSFTMHGPTEFEAVERYDLAGKARSACFVACISDFCRSQLMRLVEPRHWEKMSVVRMTTDVDRYAPPADGRGRAQGEALRVLYVGRLVAEKGSPVLVDAIAELTRRGVPVKLRVIGGGGLDAELSAQVSRLNVGCQVDFLGPIGQDDMPTHYQWADVFCLPSFQEGLPVVLMEAMASELPVVTTRIAAVEELVNDVETGFVIAPGRADLVADALEALAHDEELRSRMGRHGRTAVLSEFTSAPNTEAMMHLLMQSPGARAV